MESPFLVLKETAKLFSRMTEPFYIPNSNVQVIQFLYLPVNIWCYHNCAISKKRQFYFLLFNLYVFYLFFLVYFHWVELSLLPSSNPQKSVFKERATRKRKRENKSAYLSPNISIITLTVNALSTLIKRHRMPEWINNHDSIILPKRNPFQTYDIS